MKVVIVIQARMGSTRLPGKVLKKILDKPMLWYLIDRVSRVEFAHEIVVSTTINPADDSIVDFCKDVGASCYRGSEHDVLSRYYETAKQHNADCVVRICSDSPLVDPFVVDKLIKIFTKGKGEYDYVSNTLEESYPVGLHTEVFSIGALENSHSNATDPVEREHVTPYIYRNPNIFKLNSVALDVDLSNYRWTVDYPEDFKLVKNIFENIYPSKTDFDMFDVVNYLKHNPEIASINGNFKKKQTL